MKKIIIRDLEEENTDCDDVIDDDIKEDMFLIMYPNVKNEEDREEVLERNFDKFTS